MNEITNEDIIKMLKDGTMYNIMFNKYQNQPTEKNYVAILRTLCEMEELWYIAKNIKFGDPNFASDIPKGAIMVLKDNHMPNVLIAPDGKKAYAIYTSMDCIHAIRKSEDSAIAVSILTMKKILANMQADKVNHIIVNYGFNNELVLDDSAVEAIKHFLEQ